MATPRVTVVDVGPRDGLQNEPDVLAPEVRAEVEAAKRMTETVHESLRIAVANELAAEARAERLAEALRVAEAALADIGDADREPGDDVAWCERRAAQALPTARAALEQEEGREQ